MQGGRSGTTVRPYPWLPTPGCSGPALDRAQWAGRGSGPKVASEDQQPGNSTSLPSGFPLLSRVTPTYPEGVGWSSLPTAQAPQACETGPELPIRDMWSPHILLTTWGAPVP